MRGNVLGQLAVLAVIALIASTSLCLLGHDNSVSFDFCVSLLLATSGVVFTVLLMPTEQLVSARVSRRRITSLDPIALPPKV